MQHIPRHFLAPVAKLLLTSRPVDDSIGFPSATSCSCLPRGGRNFPLDEVVRSIACRWTPGQSGPVCRKRSRRPSEVVAKWVSTAARQDHSRPADENRDSSIGKAGTRQPLSLTGGSCPRLLQGIVEHKDAKVDASRSTSGAGSGSLGITIKMAPFVPIEAASRCRQSGIIEGSGAHRLAR